MSEHRQGCELSWSERDWYLMWKGKYFLKVLKGVVVVLFSPLHPLPPVKLK